MTKEDIVNPKRYTQNKLQCWDFWIKAGLDPLIASAVKYVWRYKYKNGIEDLKKAKVFLINNSFLCSLQHVQQECILTLQLAKTWLM